MSSVPGSGSKSEMNRSSITSAEKMMIMLGEVTLINLIRVISPSIHNQTFSGMKSAKSQTF